MKRSIVVNLIANWFYSCNVEPDEADKIGNELLTELEKLGMLPPRAKIKGTQFEDNYWEEE